VTTWDPTTGGPDEDTSDGRAYLIAKGGRFDAVDAEFSDLGFRIGESSGVAWRGWPGEPVRGDVTRSWFVKNYFGAYTFEATGMRWLDDVFAWNRVYGFDPHDHSEGFVVEGNVAMLNGSHGLIFSRGCIANLIRGNTSFANGGGGIVLDDGRLANDGDPRHAQVVPSSQNTVDGNLVWGNGVGIVLEGGTGNIVRNNLIALDRVGVRIKNRAASNSLTGNLVVGSALMGIHVIAGATDNVISGDVVVGGKVGISVGDGSGNRIVGNDVRGIAGRGIVLQGAVAATVITDNEVTGQGTSAIDVTHATGHTPSMIARNSTVDWAASAPAHIDSAATFLHGHPAILAWAVIFLVPLAWWLPARRRRLFASRRRGTERVT
jgi:parallel beta-helix repeat protein